MSTRRNSRSTSDIVRADVENLELLATLDADERLAGHHRLAAVRAHLFEKAGDREAAIAHYRIAADRATNLPERSYLVAQAARLRDELG
jgi:predicted RNA polymerase sigma factor